MSYLAHLLLQNSVLFCQLFNGMFYIQLEAEASAIEVIAGNL